MKKKQPRGLSTFVKPSVGDIIAARADQTSPIKKQTASGPPTAIKKPKQILYADIPNELRYILQDALRFTLPGDDAYKRFSTWKTNKNWGVLLQVYGSPLPAKGAKNMVIYVKWRFKGGILEPCRGYLDLVKAINSSETNKLAAYLP